MGYAFVVGCCVACHKTFSFNPRRVPSLIYKGRREPLCRECAERWNEIHQDSRREILEGAYDPFPEEEL